MNASQRLARQYLQSVACSDESGMLIEADAEGVEVNLTESKLRFHHSFVSGPLARRTRQSSQAVIRACNNKQRNITTVLDLTAGWGVDSLTLASHGQSVTMLEQNTLVYAIVAYSLALLEPNSSNSSISSRVLIENFNALNYLQQIGENHGFGCIYLDPMFPAHKTTAKPVKEMQILQALTENIEIDACFELALLRAHNRVVVKRPARAANFSSRKPDLVYREKTIRFDVYLRK